MKESTNETLSFSVDSKEKETERGQRQSAVMGKACSGTQARTHIEKLSPRDRGGSTAHDKFTRLTDKTGVCQI